MTKNIASGLDPGKRSRIRNRIRLERFKLSKRLQIFRLIICRVFHTSLFFQRVRRQHAPEPEFRILAEVPEPFRQVFSWPQPAPLRPLVFQRNENSEKFRKDVLRR